MKLFGNIELARRLESAEARIAAGFAEAWTRGQLSPPTAVLAIAGGQAAFAGVGSPLTHAVGLGMAGPVSACELDRVEQFYRSRGAAVTLDICPFADPSLHELLGLRSYRITEFNNVLVRRIDTGPFYPGTHDIRQAAREDEPAWASTVSRGFFERDELTAEERVLTGALFHLDTGVSWLARIEGLPVAAAGMAIQDRVALLFADSTIASYRHRGLHSALIQARLAYASEQGCDIATASTLPGSVSQANYERLGFQVIYTKHIISLE